MNKIPKLVCVKCGFVGDEDEWAGDTESGSPVGTHCIHCGPSAEPLHGSSTCSCCGGHMVAASQESARARTRCECECGCTDQATTTDDGGGQVCSECADYVCTPDGECICSRASACPACGEERMRDSEHGSEYVPCACEVVEEQGGEWEVWWESACAEDVRCISRHATHDAALAAVARRNHDLHQSHRGNLLCGYAVRREGRPVDDDGREIEEVDDE